MAKTPMATDVLVGARIRMRRKELGLSQGKLGASLGITFQQIQKYEKGTNRVGASRLAAIARVLDAPITSFFEAGDDSGSPSALQIITQPGAQDLLAAFSRISDPTLRKAVVTLARNLAAAEALPEQQNTSVVALNR